MLPDTIYRLLPYIYIVVGVVFALLIDSALVYISAVLLVITGFLVLWLRYAGGARYRPLAQDSYVAADMTPEHHARTERRHADDVHEFPIINNNGEIIALDRRIASI